MRFSWCEKEVLYLRVVVEMRWANRFVEAQIVRCSSLCRSVEDIAVFVAIVFVWFSYISEVRWCSFWRLSLWSQSLFPSSAWNILASFPSSRLFPACVLWRLCMHHIVFNRQIITSCPSETLDLFRNNNLRYSVRCFPSPFSHIQLYFSTLSSQPRFWVS